LNESAETLAAIVHAERVRRTRIEDPVVLGRTAPSQTCPVLVRDEALIRRRLSDLFLDLVIDRDLQVAFTRQAGAQATWKCPCCFAAGWFIWSAQLRARASAGKRTPFDSV